MQRAQRKSSIERRESRAGEKTFNAEHRMDFSRKKAQKTQNDPMDFFVFCAFCRQGIYPCKFV